VFERVCLVRYNEIGLKGRNRSEFERRLRENLEAALVALPARRPERIASRVAVRVSEPARADEVASRIAEIPGVQSVAAAYRTARDGDDIARAALLALQDAGRFETFRVEAHRSNTDYPVPSMETARVVGAILKEATGASVNLSAPDVCVRIDVVQGHAYVSSREFAGVGGLPVGTSGRMVGLLSAGIDSPVACWRMMRRGGTVVGVHFSGRPQTGDASERLVFEIGERLARSGGLARIYVVPFGDVQREVALASPPDLRVLLYRRLMVRIAEEVARVERAKALVTGESLGQVASQTLTNLAVIDDAAPMTVLRPLVAVDKQEIIDEAKRLGTFEISIQPDQDCCQLFTPRDPETHAKLADVQAAEKQLDVEALCADAIDRTEQVELGDPRRAAAPADAAAEVPGA